VPEFFITLNYLSVSVSDSERLPETLPD